LNRIISLVTLSKSFLPIEKKIKYLHSCVVVMLVNTFDGIDSTELGKSNSFTKIGRTFFGNVSKSLLDIKKKYFTEILIVVLLLALVLVITVASGFACWNCGFESRRCHECLSLVGAVCCQVEVCDSG
jgi:hypothetical protein